jgi:uncharacterized membrane protein YbjE (DUF340 family)
MHLVFASILYILMALLAGYGLGRVLPERMTQRAVGLLTPMIWLLLFLCGKEFGGVLDGGPAFRAALGTAAVFAALTTILPWGMILLLVRMPRVSSGRTLAARTRVAAFASATRDCLAALGMVAAGVLVAHAHVGWLDQIGATQFLYLLVVLVGMDLAEVRLGGVWRAPGVVTVPVLVIAGSWIGGAAAGWCTGEGLQTSLALSSGFGWVTLSSILVNDRLGAHYGAVVLLTDLFRELTAVVALYAVGSRYARESIGLCGATALDATLPLIRQQCGPQHVPLALVSGFLLTVLSPVFIVIALIGH